MKQRKVLMVNKQNAKHNSTMHEEGATVSVSLWFVCVSVVTLRAFFCICF